MFPILTRLAIDPAHPFPFIANGGFAMGLQLRREADDTVLEALLPVPAQVPRFVRLADGATGRIRFLPLEALLEVFLGKLFPGYAMLGALRLPGAARQRPRGRGRGRGPRFASSRRR